MLRRQIPDRLIKAAGLGLILMILPAFGVSERLFAPKSEPWPRWEAHDPASTETIDHSTWDGLLARHLRQADLPGAGPVALFAYGAVPQSDRQALAGYIDALAAHPISRFNRDEQLAYWLNLYNALTVQVVLDHYPVQSIRDIDISPGLFASGPWGKKLVEVDGKRLTLNDIEHRILRPVWRDPRIHYGVNCASIGCPDLRATAYRGAEIDAALGAAARAYVNSPRGVAIDGDEVTASKIYAWFIEDFGGTEAAVIAHLSDYADPPLAERLARIGELSGTAYDWSLNDARE